MPVPAVDRATLVVYDRSATHHHRNESSEDPPETTFALILLVTPEHFGVRVQIADEMRRGSVSVDAGVVYEWSRPATPQDDLEQFAIEVAIPQSLNCASTILVEAATAVGSTAPFYGLDALDQLLEEFRNRPRNVSDTLAANIKRLAERQRKKPSAKASQK